MESPIAGVWFIDGAVSRKGGGYPAHDSWA